MNVKDRDTTRILDEVTAAIRTEKLDDSVVEAAAERVWARLSQQRAETTETVERIRGCADFEKLMPAYLAGSLSEARTLLVEDHTRECLSCRKALKQARSGTQSTSSLEQLRTSPTASLRATVLKWGIAAVLLIGAGLIAVPFIERFFSSVKMLQAVVQAADGPVYRVSDAQISAIAVGEAIRAGESIRTPKDSGAVVRLPDGSLVEMSQRCEFSLAENSQGLTLHLARGNVIVQAAKQRSRPLYVRTADCLVSVTGTIFSVNSGTKGSRVSVIEGQVYVDFAGQKHILLPGDQITTRDSLSRVQVSEEIGWSRQAAHYRKLVAELAALRKELDEKVARPGLRYESRLLNLVPEGTIFYVALPNLSATLSESYQLIQERVEQNPALKQWWEKELAGARNESKLQEIFSKIREFGQYLGPEILLTAQIGLRGEPEGLLILAELNNPSGFRFYLEQQIQNLLAGDKKGLAVRILDHPAQAASLTEAQQDRDELFVWLHDNLLVAAPRLESVQQAARTVQPDQVSRFAKTPFYARIAELYREGAGLIVAADLERMIAHGLRQSAGISGLNAAGAAEQLGLLNLKHFILELKEGQGKPHNRAVLTFNEQARGITNWLAAPGPMGALQFISPDANVVAAFVIKDPVVAVDDLLASLKTLNPSLWQQLEDFQAQHGIDLKRDLAAPLGGEFAFALDGPVLPVPSWKLVFEVYDSAHLQQSFERIVQQLNQWAALQGKAGLRWEQTEVDGRIFYALKSVDFGAELHYTYTSGYLVAAPSRALVERAIRYRDSGSTLTHSPQFIATLPEDKQTNFSALLYQNLGSVVGPIARGIGNLTRGGGSEARQMLKSMGSISATLAYAYALNDRIIFSANSEEGPFGLTPGSLLRLTGSPAIEHIMRESRHR